MSKACGASAVLSGDQYWCDREDGHHGPHTNEKHQAAWGGSIQFQEEAPVIPEIDNDPLDPLDALRLAVDLHMHRDTSTDRVVQDAAWFLQWLRENKEGK